VTFEERDSGMKKTLWVCSLLLPVFIFVSIARSQETKQVELTHFSGSVEVLLEGANDYVGAEDGMVLEAGDKIKTGSDSSLELSFNEENTNLVRVSENTNVKITLSGDEKLEMDEGEVFTTIGNLPSGSAFEIRTPTAVSGARGTDWVTKVSEEGTDVEAVDNVSYVKHFETNGALSREPTLIVPGKMTRVQKFQKPLAPQPISLARQQQWMAVKQDVRKHAGEAMVRRQQQPPFNRKEFLEKQQNRGPGGKDRTGSDSRREKPQGDSEGARPLVSKEGERLKQESSSGERDRAPRGMPEGRGDSERRPGDRPLPPGDRGGERQDRGRQGEESGKDSFSGEKPSEKKDSFPGGKPQGVKGAPAGKRPPAGAGRRR